MASACGLSTSVTAVLIMGIVTPASSAIRFASASPTSASSGLTCPPGRRVRSRPSNPAAFAASHGLGDGQVREVVGEEDELHGR